jgi:hypothetical protein
VEGLAEDRRREPLVHGEQQVAERLDERPLAVDPFVALGVGEAVAAGDRRGPRLRSGYQRSAQMPGWLVECLRLGVGHASTVRPDPSTLGVVGERGSHHKGRSR